MLPVAFVIMILIPAVMFFGHIRTMLSVKKVTDGLYTMKNYECTDTDGMLGADATSVSGFLQWVFDRHFYGASARFDESNFGFGCSAFAAVTPEGGHLFGRNFDYLETDTLLIYSHPEGAYESIGVTDLGVLGVGQTYPISPDSPTGRLYMTITPYLVYDGMNEKGVVAGILEIDIGETHQDNGKPDLPVYCAIRGILDKCASVEEALDLLASYDIHSDIGSSCHLFITDSGLAARWSQQSILTAPTALSLPAGTTIWANLMAGSEPWRNAWVLTVLFPVRKRWQCLMKYRLKSLNGPASIILKTLPWTLSSTASTEMSTPSALRT